MVRSTATAQVLPEPQPEAIGSELPLLRLAAVALDVNVRSAGSPGLEEARAELGALCRKTMNLSRRLDRGGADELFYEVCFLVRVRIAEERRMLAIDGCSGERTLARLRRTRAELHRSLALLADAFASATWTPVRIPRRTELNPKTTPDDPVYELAAVLLTALRADANDATWVLGVAEVELGLVESHPAFTTLPVRIADAIGTLHTAISSWERGERPPALGRILLARVHALCEMLTD
jgi:hypothetical protein